MKAELKPLVGKYYGTEVEISSTDKAFGGGHVTIWVAGNYEPSEREIVGLQEHHELEGYDPPTQEDFDEIACDSHYETQTSYEIACKLVAAING